MISIIMPVKNESLTLFKSLNHLQKLRDLNICEIILVDGGSTDNTIKIASNLVDHILITKSGRAHQQNIGASIAKGDILLFLHADTVITKEQIVSLKSIIEKNVWGFFKIIFDNRKIRYKILAYLINFRSKVYNYGTGDQVIYINRKIFNKIRGFPPLEIMEDIKICSILKQISQPSIRDSYVITSARRWEKYGFFKTILRMRILRFFYHLGVESKKLARYYE